MLGEGEPSSLLPSNGKYMIKSGMKFEQSRFRCSTVSCLSGLDNS